MRKSQLGSLRVRILTGRTIYSLNHASGKYLDEDIKLIGVFSTKALAQETARLLKNKPGFRDQSGRFRVDAIVIDQIGWVDGFTEAQAAGRRNVDRKPQT
jgi:hypothetical protein